MSRKLSIRDLPLQGKTLLIRVDFNVPLENGTITDDSRILATLPTLRYAIDHGAALVLISHLGRPKGKKIAELSLAPCATRLSQLLKCPVTMAKDCVGQEVDNQVRTLQPGQILLLENLRFHEGEEKPELDPSFAKQLSQLGSYYIDDAFGAAHRPHASITTIAQYFPGKAASGFLLEKEIAYLGEKLTHPARPFYAILGGAKIGSKIGLIHAFSEKVDRLFLVGGMAFTFLKAQGKSIGASLYDETALETAKELLSLFAKRNIPLDLPLDCIAIPKDSLQNPSAEVRIIDTATGIPDGFQGVDIGPKTIDLLANTLPSAQTIFWNGPAGVFEIPRFAKGTEKIAQVLSKSNGLSIVGGGDSIAALNALGLADQIGHLSTGGGASLEYIEKGSLVGYEALSPASTLS